METPGTIVVVRETSTRVPQTMRVRVVEPRYVAPWGPSFTGEVLEGRFAGRTVAFLYRNVVRVESTPGA